MAIKTLNEILASVNTIIGENASDEALTLMDDITDTFNAKDSTDWEKKYKENDASWRQRYRERFLSGNTELDSEVDKDDDESESEVKSFKYEDLFKEG